MLVTKVDVVPVAVPFLEPVTWRYGEARGVTSAVVRIHTNNGIEGIGEAPGEPSIRILIAALRELGDALVGQDPRNVRRLVASFVRAGSDHFPYVTNIAIAALEMALLDISGKSLGCPVYDLLGGCTNEDIEFYWHVNPRDNDPQDAADKARAGAEQGFRTMYLKGSSEIRRDLRLLVAVREAVGDGFGLRIDPNEGWDPHIARRYIDQLRDLDLEFIEQPFAKDNLGLARRFGSEAKVNIAANQSAWRVMDVARVLMCAAADVVVTGVHQTGGILRLMATAELCMLAGVPLVRHSLCDLGIGTAAAMQVLAAVPLSALAHQTHLTLLEDDLLHERWTFHDGKLAIRKQEGLGVNIRDDALVRYSRHYEKFGEYRGYAPELTNDGVF